MRLTIYSNDRSKQIPEAVLGWIREDDPMPNRSFSTDAADQTPNNTDQHDECTYKALHGKHLHAIVRGTNAWAHFEYIVDAIEWIYRQHGEVPNQFPENPHQ